MPKLITPVITPVTTSDVDSWKAHAQEMHDFLIEAGFTYEDSITEQLDFNTVVSIPTNVYYGFRVYSIQDELASEGYGIFIRLDFGTGLQGLRSNGATNPAIKVKVTVGDNVTASGTVMCGLAQSDMVGFYPQTYLPPTGGLSNTSPAGSPKLFMMDFEQGSYYFVFNLNGRGGKDGWSSSSPYNGSSLTLFIQRSLDSGGAPTNEGFCCYLSDIKNSTGSSYGSMRWPVVSPLAAWCNKVCGFTYETKQQIVSPYVIQHVGGMEAVPVEGKVQIAPTYILTDRLMLNPNMVLYRGPDFSEGVEFDVETSPGVFTNFKALGAGTGIMFGELGQQTHIAIRWD